MEVRKVILTVSNDLTIDQRLHKVCKSLQKAGFSPVLVGRNKPDSLPLELRSYQTVRLPMVFHSGKFFYAELNVRLFFYLLFHSFTIVTANDLDTLLPCFLVSKIKHKRLVYDSHEYFTELPELAHRKFEKFCWTSLERFIFPKLRYVSTVGEMIAREYRQRYRVPVAVVRNMPLFSVPVNDNEAKKTKILLYQGAINVGRGLELMIDAMPLLPEFILWIIGGGPLLEEIKQLAKNHSNIVVHGQKPFAEVKKLTEQAFVGFSLEEDLGLNYRYALPNKLFDYVQAGVPVICSALPEMQLLVEENQIGVVLKERTATLLAATVKQISGNEAGYNELKQNCEKASLSLNWEAEEAVLLSLYK